MLHSSTTVWLRFYGIDMAIRHVAIPDRCLFCAQPHASDTFGDVSSLYRPYPVIVQSCAALHQVRDLALGFYAFHEIGKSGPISSRS